MSNKQALRILIEVVSGIVISIIINTIAITMGYSSIRGTDLNHFAVNILGVNIFNIANVDGTLTGTPQTQNMFLMGVICSVILVVVLEFVFYFKKKKNS